MNFSCLWGIKQLSIEKNVVSSDHTLGRYFCCAYSSLDDNLYNFSVDSLYLNR